MEKAESNSTLIFGKKNYLFMALGFVIVILGLFLMTGGGMTDPNVWDESAIYSGRRTFLAPLVMLIGFGLVVYSIFVKK